MARLYGNTLIANFKWMRRVSSPRVSKGCFGKAYVDAKGTSVVAALPHGRATDTRSHPIEIRYIKDFIGQFQFKFRKLVIFYGIISPPATEQKA